MDAESAEANDIRTKVLQNTLDEISSRQETADSDSDKLCCVICLDSVSEACVAQPCAHRNFDFLCLASWLQEQPTCPLCKAAVKEVRYDFSVDASEWKTFPVKPKEEAERKPGDFAHREPAPARPSPLFNRRRRERPPPRPVAPDEAMLRRRHVYRNQLYSLHVGSNRYSRYQELSPELFARDAELVSRARKWIRRELQVFEFLSTPASPARSGHAGGNSDAAAARRANNAEFLLEYIVAILKTVDIQGSCGQAEDMLQEFLGRENTRLFLHELRAWLRSPYTSLESWDRNVQYDERKAQPRRSPEEEEEEEQNSYRAGRWREGFPRPARRQNENRYKPYGRRQEQRRERWRDASRRYDPS